jgi:hypothetical protein
VWVDGHNRVRREKLSLAMPTESGAPAGTSLTVTTDYYDFGVPVRVSAPPASQVDTAASAFASGAAAASASGSSSSGSWMFFGSSSTPPTPSGTLTPDQAAAAEQAVAAFWTALGRNNASAVAATVLPSQRSCVQSNLGGDSGAPTITVSDLHITSAQPAGDSAATVRFTVKAEASLDGQDVPILPGASGTAQWLATTELAGHWYVNIDGNTGLAFSGSCG